MDISRKELSKFNGKNGSPSYVAYSGKVYDVSSSDLWIDGEHQFTHFAGQDLTNAMADAPHEADVFERFKPVGNLID